MENDHEAHEVGPKDYKIFDWRNVAIFDPRWGDRLETREISSVANAYVENFKRIAQIPNVVLVAFADGNWYGTKIYHAYCQAYAGSERDPLHEKWKRFLDFHGQILRGEYGEYRKIIPRPLSQISWTDSTPFGAVTNSLGKQLESLMYMQLVMMWTAIETLAGDLWETSVNTVPNLLCPSTKNVPWGDVREVTEDSFDLRKRVGTVLRLRRDFTSLKGIREHYEDSFNYHQETIKDALRDRSLDALATVRNVIVHKSGIMDREYEDSRNAAPDLLPPAECGKPLPIDGAIVRRLLNPARDSGIALIKAVDSWLTNHRKKNG